jgi:hypothetical protein
MTQPSGPASEGLEWFIVMVEVNLVKYGFMVLLVLVKYS